MRKCFLVLLVLALLCPGAEAAEQPCIALTFDGVPEDPEALLRGLQENGAKATFFLPEGTDAAVAQAIADGGHELGFLCPVRRGEASLSRRSIADSLENTGAVLPREAKPRFVRPSSGEVTDALAQVARVKGLCILGWSVAQRSGERLISIRDGDVIRLEGQNVRGALSLALQLRSQGYRMVTVSELAKLRRLRLHPGTVYRTFPLENRPQAPS